MNWLAAKLLSLTSTSELPAVGQLGPERHPLDVVERDPERAQVEQQRLLHRPELPEAGDAVEAVHVRRPREARPSRA